MTHPADGSSPHSSATASKLAAELAALQVRQAALHDALSRRNASNTNASDAVDATFSRLPEYVEKLQRLQQAMDALAMRTTQMRARCTALIDQR